MLSWSLLQQYQLFNPERNSLWHQEKVSSLYRLGQEILWQSWISRLLSGTLMAHVSSCIALYFFTEDAYIFLEPTEIENKQLPPHPPSTVPFLQAGPWQAVTQFPLPTRSVLEWPKRSQEIVSKYFFLHSPLEFSTFSPTCVKPLGNMVKWVKQTSPICASQGK